MKCTLRPGPVIVVGLKNHHVAYATDGSLPNPLESVYGCITGCAAVFAKKACRELAISEDGIGIDLRVIADPKNLGAIGKVAIHFTFPENIDQEARQAILTSVEACPVKALIEQGGSIDFVID